MKTFWSMYTEGMLDLVFIILILALLVGIGISKRVYHVDWGVLFGLGFASTFLFPFLTSRLDSAHARATTDIDDYQMVGYLLKFPLWWLIGLVSLVVYIIIIKVKKRIKKTHLDKHTK